MLVNDQQRPAMRSERLGLGLIPSAKVRYLLSRGRESLRARLNHLGDAFRLIGPAHLYDADYYIQRQSGDWRRDARHVSRVLDEEFTPTSVIDFGCAIGQHLAYFHEQGIPIAGVDKHPAAFEHAVVPPSALTKHDLRTPYRATRRYDLAICIEVAEHLPARFADVLVETLTCSADTIVFTAAPPGQGGEHHVNEQPQTYWTDRFRDEHFVFDADSTRRVKQQLDLERAVWVEKNILVFQRQS